MIKNRLEKNLKKLKPWAEKHGIEAFRLYDRDIPEYPFVVDIYGTFVVVADRREEIDFERDKKGHLDELEKTLYHILRPKDVIIKRRTPQRQAGEKSQQYQKLNRTGHNLIVREEPAKLIVNLYDYLDTGLFLDHRLVRQRVLKTVKKGSRFLNLFSYTGSVSVFAALAGAQTTSVDMSKTYTEWAMENFRENGLQDGPHEFVVDDVMAWLEEQSNAKKPPKYDFIFLDPPTFSNSKKMDGNFEVERDQMQILKQAMKLLAPGGQMIFSNNKRGFKLDPAVLGFATVKNISRDTLPADFHDAKIRSVFMMSPK